MAMPTGHEAGQRLPSRCRTGVDRHEPAATNQRRTNVVGRRIHGMGSWHALEREPANRLPTGLLAEDQRLSSSQQGLGQGPLGADVTVRKRQENVGGSASFC